MFQQSNTSNSEREDFAKWYKDIWFGDGGANQIAGGRAEEGYDFYFLVNRVDKIRNESSSG